MRLVVMRSRTVHGLTLHDIVSVISGKEVLEVALWIFDVSDLIFFVDEISSVR